MALNAETEKMLQLMDTLLSLVQNISTGTRMIQQATGNFNHLATMPVNVASIYSSLLQRIGSQFLGPLGGMLGAYAGKAIFGTGYDPKTGQPTSRFMDPVGLTLTGFQYNVAAGQNQAYLNIAADAMFLKQQDKIKQLYSSMLGILAPGARTIVDFMFDPLQKRTMAASTNALMTSVAQAMLTDPGKILSKDQRDSLDKLRDSMTDFGFKTQMGLEYNGGFNAGATLTLASAIASQDTSIKAGLSGANGKQVADTGELLKKRTKLLSDALSPLRDVFGNLMPILLAKLLQITGQGMTSMSADKLKQLTKHLHGTMAATNVGLLQLGQQQALVQQASAAMGNTILGALAMHVAMLNVQGVTGNAGFLGSRQKFQLYVTKTTVGAANSYNANIIAGALNILTARLNTTQVKALQEAAKKGDIATAMTILKTLNISLWLALRAAGWLADPTARRYGTLMAINAGGKDIDADMQAAFMGYKSKKGGNLNWTKFEKALRSGIESGKSGNQLLKHISLQAGIGRLDVYWLTQLEPVKAGITSRAHRYNLQKQQKKLYDDMMRLLSALRFLKAFVTPRSAGGLLGGMHTKDSGLRITIYNDKDLVIGSATQNLLTAGTYTDLEGVQNNKLDSTKYSTLDAKGNKVAADSHSITKALDLSNSDTATFRRLSGRHQRELAIMGVLLRNAYLKDIGLRGDTEQTRLKLLDKRAIESLFGVQLNLMLDAGSLAKKIDGGRIVAADGKTAAERIEALLKARKSLANKAITEGLTTKEKEDLLAAELQLAQHKVAVGTATKLLRAKVIMHYRMQDMNRQIAQQKNALIDLSAADSDDAKNMLRSYTDPLQFIAGLRTLKAKDPTKQDAFEAAIAKYLANMKLVSDTKNFKGSVDGNIKNIGKLVLSVLKLLAEKLIQILGMQESKDK